MRSTKAIINLQAIRHNLVKVHQFAPKTKVMAVVKADAYGHGIVQVAKSLNEAECIAVACMDEAITLRRANIKTPIVLLEGFFSEKELKQALKYDLQTVVHQHSQLDALEKLFRDSPKPIENSIIVWLKLDSGMNRLGFDMAGFTIAYERLKKLKSVKTVNLMSHLACADDIDSPLNLQQIKQFKNAIEQRDGECSLANSAGIVAWPESHFDWIRPGIILYGCSPMLGVNGLAHQLIPAMTLQSQLFSIRHLKAGDKVGYGATWQATKPTRIGVVAIGYGDGYPRHAKEGTPILINGKTYPLVGKVSMDMITVDVGTDDEFEIGCKAILWGDGLPVETIAEWADTIPYTLLCGVTSRVKFQWVE